MAGVEPAFRIVVQRRDATSDTITHVRLCPTVPLL
jgi:hypothetical protein